MSKPDQVRPTNRVKVGNWLLFRPTTSGLARLLRLCVVDPFRSAYGSVEAPNHLWFRLITFGILLVTVHLWLLLNQGYTYLQVGTPALVAVLAGTTRVLASRDKVVLRTSLKHKLFFLLRTPMLLAAAALFACVSIFWSSARVLASGVENRSNLRIAVLHAETSGIESLKTPLGSRRTFESDTVRFRTFTAPWGRLYDLRVEGCSSHLFTLWPWSTRTIHLDDVLDACPSLLLRVPAELHSVLDGGKIKVTYGSKLISEIATESDRGAVLLGRNLPVPGHFETVWKTELEARGMTGQNAARSLQNWHRPIHVVPKEALRPQMRLSVIFETQAGEVLADRKDLVVGKERIEDVPLLCFE